MVVWRAVMSYVEEVSKVGAGEYRIEGEDDIVVDVVKLVGWVCEMW